MVFVNNYSARMNPSVHYGREGLNNRYRQNALETAMNRSIFQGGKQVTNITYNTGRSNAVVAGEVVGNILGNLPNIASGAINLFHKIFG